MYIGERMASGVAEDEAVLAELHFAIVDDRGGKRGFWSA
jgi:hypothetical protein